MFKYIGIFVRSVWHDWLARISGGLTVPFTVLSWFSFSPSAQKLFGALAILALILTVFRLWVKEYQAAHQNALQFKLIPTTSTTERHSKIFLEGPNLCRCRAEIAVRFENSDTARLYVSDFQLSICEQLRFRRQRVIATRRAFTIQSESVYGREWFQQGIPIDGREVSVPHTFMFAFDLPDNLSNKLGSEHFVRLTMSAMNQSDIFLNCPVEWNAARINDGAPLTP